MNSDTAIRAQNVSKKYGRSIKQTMAYGLQDIGRNLLGLGTHADRLRRGEFWAVDDVSFEVKRGETLGLIGPNGSGKTTMLKMLNGIFWPDKGKISMRGRVGALIGVGSGFHPVLTGRENIFVNGAIMGMGRREMKKKFDSIVDFADIGDFLDTPVKHYSSGMYVRLGFAVAIHCEPDILLVDEILAVGDASFRAKCMDKMKSLETKGISKIFVSHDMNSVYLLCDRAMYILNGKTKSYGTTAEVVGEYKKDMDLAMRKVSVSLRLPGGASGTGEVLLRKVAFLDEEEKEAQSFRRGGPFCIRIYTDSKAPGTQTRFSVSLYSDMDVLVSRQSFLADASRAVDYRLDPLPLNLGRYLVSVECTDASGLVVFDRREKEHEFIVEEGELSGGVRERWGFMHVPCRWAVTCSE